MVNTTKGIPDNLTGAEVIDRIFRDPSVKYGLVEFEDLGKAPQEILKIFPKTVGSGRAQGEVRYYLKCFKRGKDIQVYSEKKSNPEEIVRQLWLYKLHQIYGYPWDHIQVEYAVDFGTVTSEKAADIFVSQKDGITAKIVFETKNPERKDGIEQLKAYLNAVGSPVGVWSNGQERVILYRPYPREFEDTLTEIPTFSEEPNDVLETRLTVDGLKREFDFKRIIQNLEELVLANAGYDEFNEIFKIIFAKLYDEKAARERKEQRVFFRKSADSSITYDTINGLFHRAMEEWPGIFDENENIKLTPQHLQVCIGPLERICLMGANMRVIDDAFEYLMPMVAKKKNCQFFTPRYVVDMCVKMLNPKKKEFVIDPACGSAGFLIHTMEYAWPAPNDAKKEQRKHNYAAKYLWGFDFDERSAKVSRALMLIAGDGRSHVFQVNSLDPREWFSKQEGLNLQKELRDHNLLANRPPASKVLRESDAWDYLKDLKFDVLLTNPPFAGEIRDRELLRRYVLAEPALTRKSKKGPKEERDVLFIERCLHMLKPGGRMAIVLPQGKFNNLSLAYIREWISRQARLLAVVGLHANTFKPHTGTKTSILFLQKYTHEETSEVNAIRESVKEDAPDYTKVIEELIEKTPEDGDVSEENLPKEIAELLEETFETEPEEIERATERNGSGELEIPEEVATPDVDILTEEIEQKRLRYAVNEKSLDKIKEEKKACRKNRKDSPDEVAKKVERRERLQTEEKRLKSTLIALEKEITELKVQLAMLTVRGRLGLLLQDQKALDRLKQKRIDAEIAKKFDYPIFMATPEKGGKNSSGAYIYRKDENGNVLKDSQGNPLVEQDYVTYLEDDPSGIAERFVKWARERNLVFWRED